MKKLAGIIGATALTAIAATSAQAGGIDRTRLGFGMLFEKGRYLELGVSHAAPKVSGTYRAPAFGPFVGTSTGDMAKDYTQLSFSYKADINDRLAYAFYLNKPFGADASYGAGPYRGLNAEWKSQQAALLLKYKVADRVSIYGGLKYVRSKPTIAIPDALIRGGFAAAAANPATPPAQAALAGALAASPAGALNYTATGESDGRLGVILGVAYERPEIALRVGLTYESGFTHKFRTTEALPAAQAVPTLAPLFATSTTRIKMPQSITLDFQSGVAADTLVFGSLRWSEWSVWEVRPQAYNALTGSDITSFDNNVLTWQLGVGRKINDNFSVFARVGYEKSNGGVASRLAPTDGNRSIGIGGTYTQGNMKITAGLEYVKLGNAVDGSGTQFSKNKAVGFGMSVGYRF